VEVATPDYEGVLGELFGAIMAMVVGREQDDNALEDVLAEKLEGKNWPTTTRTEYYDLVKEKDGWKVFLNYEGNRKVSRVEKTRLKAWRHRRDTRKPDLLWKRLRY